MLRGEKRLGGLIPGGECRRGAVLQELRYRQLTESANALDEIGLAAANFDEHAFDEPRIDIAVFDAAEDTLAPDRRRLGGKQLGRLEAVPISEQLGAGADEHNVRGGLHDLASDLDRVTVTLYGSDGAGGERTTVHNARVELDLPEHVGDPAGTDAVIVTVILDTLDRRDGGVHRRLARMEGGDRGWQADPRVGTTDYDRDSHVHTIARSELCARACGGQVDAA